ncbi:MULTISPECIES: HAD family hydrolase [unclassified Saccharothrix]|uniref:HAD family hydrolase n=1 Tax=unclassified Saccharothrix TaxID=2593673 RepID=UPI00307DFFAF
MTTEHVPVDDSEVLRNILATTDALLLDFDGPICAVFANLSAQNVANQLRGVLTDSGYVDLPRCVKETSDPFCVLNHAATLGAEEADSVEASLRALELEAVSDATPTPEAKRLIQACAAAGLPIAIVSNNSTQAIQAYLERQSIASAVGTISGRRNADVSLLKPDSYLVAQAASELGVSTKSSVMIGDSTSDMTAIATVGGTGIGFVNKHRKTKTLAEAGAHALVTDLSIIAVILEAA